MKIVLLAGGRGKRLWPLSRTNYPKQFLKFGSENSLLQIACMRNLKLVEPKDLFIITCQEFYREVVRQVEEISPFLVENIIIEPESKNTAPAIALIAHFLREKKKIAKEEVIFVFPSDHLISPEEKYVERVKQGQNVAKKGSMVVFGVIPTFPATGFGYLKVKGDLVEKFIEKPSSEKALEYIREGSYLWNAGCFGFSLKTIEKAFQEVCPEISLEGTHEEFLARFHSFPTISFDYAIMEKIAPIFCVPFDLEWSDVGAWDQVYDVLKKDEKGNATSGEVVTFETKNSLLMTQKRLLVAVGLEEMCVIETEDAILVAKKKDAQKIKEVVESLKLKGRREVDEHVPTHRPWGAYTVLEEGLRYKIKRIEVKPQAKLSLQLHYHRSEHWIVVTGTAKVTINDKESVIHEGESIFVPKSAIHRVENPGKVPLEIIEVQVGEYLGEDDIVRLEDIYGRLKQEEAFLLLRERQMNK